MSIPKDGESEIMEETAHIGQFNGVGNDEEEVVPPSAPQVNSETINMGENTNQRSENGSEWDYEESPPSSVPTDRNGVPLMPVYGRIERFWRPGYAPVVTRRRMPEVEVGIILEDVPYGVVRHFMQHHMLCKCDHVFKC